MNASVQFFSTLQQQQQVRPQQPERRRQRFDELEVHPKTLKALRRHGIHRTTEIQEKTFGLIADGKDVVARSRTGSGKTLAFLVPALERYLLQQKSGITMAEGIPILILAPTRELAAQIGQVAQKIVVSHTQDQQQLVAQVMYGGSSKDEDVRLLESRLPTVLVATPGRLKDHIATTSLQIRSTDDDDDGDTPTTTTTIHKPFSAVLRNVQTVVLDETDRLLQLGFRQDIMDILSFLPPAQKANDNGGTWGRQTLLFSATLPQNVLNVVDSVTSNDGYELVDCIQEDDLSTHTNEQTKQSYVVVPDERFWTASMEVIWDLMDAKASKPRRQRNQESSNVHRNKIMVFFPMTSLVQLYADLFNLRFGKRVFELHGKMQQRERTAIARKFRNASEGVLFTSDVSARGVDYPNVTHVVQVGAAQSRETYIHRLGRTGRAGKKGEGLLILPKLEEDFLEELSEHAMMASPVVEDVPAMNLQHDLALENRLSKRKGSRQLREELGLLVHDMQRKNDSTLESSLYLAYQAMISYYFQTSDRHQSDQVVAMINQLVRDMGLRELPAIDERRAVNIGIDTIPGLNIRKSWGERRWTGDWMDGNEQRPFQRKPIGTFDNVFDGKDGYKKGNIDRSFSPNGLREGHLGNAGRRPIRRNEDAQRAQQAGDKPRNDFQTTPRSSPRRQHAFKRSNFFQRWDKPGVFRTKS